MKFDKFSILVFCKTSVHHAEWNALEGKRCIMVCHDQDIDRRILQESELLANHGYSILIICLSFDESDLLERLSAYDKFNEPKYLENAMKAAEILFIPLQEGGLLFESNGDIWFEEIPSSAENPSHILNGHMRALIAIKKLADLTGDKKYQDYFNKGTDTLIKWLPLFDTGYWLGYDLNPKQEILCQIDWLEGKKSPLIESISLENPQTQEQTFIEVNEARAFKSYPYITGVDWSLIKVDNDKKGRSFLNGYKIRSQPVQGGAVHNVYFMMSLPTRRFNNDFIIPTFKLRIRYKDVAQGKLQLKIKPVNMNDHHNFIPFQESHLVCNGDQKWKEAIFIIYPKDLGWFVGVDYQQFHTEQLKLLGEQNDDWFFKQQAERHLYFLNSFKKNLSINLRP